MRSVHLRRFAAKVYYEGHAFHGSQRQRDVRTVEGELLRVLRRFGAGEWFKSAGRTDRGVSALGNVFAFELPRHLPPRAFNAYLPEEIRVLGVREVDRDFHPRYSALSRTYRYFAPDEGYTMSRIERACRVLEGRHSFHSFTCDRERNPERHLLEVRAERAGGVVVLTFRGESFLREMVRRMCTAVLLAGAGEIGVEEIEEALKPGVQRVFPPSPPEFLVLWEVEYGFEFEHEEYTLRMLGQRLKQRLRAFMAGTEMSRQAMDALGVKV